MTDDSLRTTYRMLDAAANRAAEGLRSMEDYARFVLDDRELTASLKGMRHELTEALSSLPRDSMLLSRDTQGDVGTDIRESAEYVRRDAGQVVAAAASRTQQALRVLEEYGKTIDGAMATSLEQIRYRCYTAAATLELRIGSASRVEALQESRLYVLVESGSSEHAFAEQVERLLAGSVDVIQLRDRAANDRTLLQRGGVGAEIARKHGKLFIMNDRADLAVAAGTDGVHVGQEELPAKHARQIVGANLLVGVSTHSIDQARQAVADGADYIGCGPVFPGRTKSFDHYVGTEYLKEVAAEIDLPAFAIGGIDSSNLDQVIASGVKRIAVTGAIRDATDPQAAAAELKQRLESVT